MPLNLGSPVDNYPGSQTLAEDLVKAYRSVPKAREEAEKNKYANIISAAEAKYAEPMQEAKIQGLLAHAQQAQQGGTLTGTPREYQSLALLKEMYGEDSDIYLGAKAKLEAALHSQQSGATGKDLINRYRVLDKLTAGQKEALYAKYRGAGGTDVDIANAIVEGKTPNQYAIDHGMSPEEASQFETEDPIYVPTESSRTAAAQTESALAEEEYLSSEISKALEGYSGKPVGFFLDQLKSDPESKQKVGRALGANALQPEIAGLRSRISNGSNAHEALKDIEARAMGRIAPFEFLVDPETYRIMQNYIHEKISEAGKRRVGVLKGGKPKLSPSEQKQKILEDAVGGHQKFVIDGETFKVAPEDLAGFKKAYGL